MSDIADEDVAAAAKALAEVHYPSCHWDEISATHEGFRNEARFMLAAVLPAHDRRVTQPYRDEIERLRARDHLADVIGQVTDPDEPNWFEEACKHKATIEQVRALCQEYARLEAHVPVMDVLAAIENGADDE